MKKEIRLVRDSFSRGGKWLLLFTSLILLTIASGCGGEEEVIEGYEYPESRGYLVELSRKRYDELYDKGMPLSQLMAGMMPFGDWGTRR